MDATLTEPAAFRREQESLSKIWTLLGLTRDVTADGDWFRASLATRSVFVQRFGDRLRGFENVCAHRSYPLRTADKGNGPVICGFHHWQYDKDGKAVEIPMCRELFGTTPRELGAGLTEIEIATCGTLVFGRFASREAGESLEASLGDSFPILEAMSRARHAPLLTTCEVKANWKLCREISLDDYHIVAVHPRTFGKDGPVRRSHISYHRLGAHSAHFATSDPDSLKTMAADCRAGTWVSANYRVFHLFPNLTIVHLKADAEFWYVLVEQYIPLAPDRTTMRYWFYPAPFAAHHSRFHRWTGWLTQPVRQQIVRYFVRKVLAEDHAVCERLQSAAHQIRDNPRFGGLEERVAWFREAYDRVVQRGEDISEDGGSPAGRRRAAGSAGTAAPPDSPASPAP